MPRTVLLTEGKSNPTEAKTATGLLRYRPADVVAILDSALVGKTAGEVFGVGGDIPFVGTLEGVAADALLIGIAPAGGRLPETWRAIVREAITRGMDIVNGLHVFLDEDAEFRELAARHGVRLVDLRRPARDIRVAEDRVRHIVCHRVHTVGHDCSVGKMLVALEITSALKAAGRWAEFLATGQTGILIAGKGVPVDHVISDFVAGAVEELVLDNKDCEFAVVEGQGSLVHPLYSGVTLSLLHGCAPQSMVFVFDPRRNVVRGTGLAMPPLREVIRIYEEIASFLTPSKVVGLAANTSTLAPGEAERLIGSTEEALGIPTCDVIRHGSEKLVDALLARDEELRRERSKRGAGTT